MLSNTLPRHSYVCIHVGNILDTSYAFTMMLEFIINLPERYTMAEILVASPSHDRSY
jgi:hypothetical protein